MKQDWYRQTTWNAEIERMFFDKLSRARKWNAPKYLSIQAGTLIYSGNPNYFPTAMMLIKKLFDEYPDATWDIMSSHIDLGEYYFRKGDYDKAREQYEIVHAYNENPSNGIWDDFTCNIRIAEIIIIQRKKDEYGFAQELLESLSDAFRPNFQSLYPAKKHWMSLLDQLNNLQKPSKLSQIITNITNHLLLLLRSIPN